MARTKLLLLQVAMLVSFAKAQKVAIRKIRQRIIGHDLRSGQNDGLINMITQAVHSDVKFFTPEDIHGNSFRKLNDNQKKYVRSIHLQQQYHQLDVFGYGVSVQEVGKHYDNTMGTNGKAFRATDSTIINGDFVENLHEFIQNTDSLNVRHKSGMIMRKIMAEHHAKHGRRARNDVQLGEPDEVKPIVYVNDDMHPIKAYLVRFVDQFSLEPSYPNFIVDEKGNALEEWEGLNSWTSIHQQLDMDISQKTLPTKPAISNTSDVNMTTRSLTTAVLNTTLTTIVTTTEAENNSSSTASTTPSAPSTQANKFGTGPGGNKKIGKKEYKKLPITDLGNANVRTVDLEHLRNEWKSIPFEFDCYRNANREINAGYSPLNDAQFYGNKLFDMFQELYDTVPLKTKPIMLKVHYRKHYDNAIFADNSCFFGDGHELYYPLTSLDVVAHEISHAITRQSSHLIYKGESGAINEAFSDMAGKAVERFVRGSATFGIGMDVTKGLRPIRCMDNPSCDGKSIDHVRKFHKEMSVHESSGIFNKVFYLMATHKSFKNDVRDAFDLFYVANTQYWTANTGFVQASELVLQATEDIKGGMHLSNDYSHIDTNAIIDALRMVGILCSKQKDYNCSLLIE